MTKSIEEQFPTSQKVYKKYSLNTENSPIVTTALAFFFFGDYCCHIIQYH